MSRETTATQRSNSADSSCHTQMHQARIGETTSQMRHVAEREGLSPDEVRTEVACGRMIIPANFSHRSIEPMAVGQLARVKINANIGNAPGSSNPEA